MHTRCKQTKMNSHLLVNFKSYKQIIKYCQDFTTTSLQTVISIISSKFPAHLLTVRYMLYKIFHTLDQTNIDAFTIKLLVATSLIKHYLKIINADYDKLDYVICIHAFQKSCYILIRVN